MNESSTVKPVATIKVSPMVEVNECPLCGERIPNDVKWCSTECRRVGWAIRVLMDRMIKLGADGTLQPTDVLDELIDSVQD